MSYECFEVTIEDKVAHIKLNRPDKRNSMNPAFWRELPQIVEDIDQNVKARAIVISSTGPHFSAGMDLAAFASKEPTSDKEVRDMRIRHGASFYQGALNTQKTFNAIEDCRLPVLAAVQGGCIGGGLDMITACDMRYASEDAFFTIFEVNIGMTADVGTFPRLVRQIPEGMVRELAYTGRNMSATEAKEIGLINRVYKDQETMVAGVLDLAKEIASKPPLAVYGCKRMINYSHDHSTADSLDYIAIWNASMLQIPEMQEAMKANTEKRSGEFVELPPLRKNASIP